MKKKYIFFLLAIIFLLTIKPVKASTIEIVDDSSSDVGLYPSIAVDSNGYSHIVYYDTDNVVVKYAVNSSGSWLKGNIDDTGGPYGTTSIDLDSNGNPHVSYYDDTADALAYAYCTSNCTDGAGNWTKTIVDSSGDVGRDNSIKLDTNNNPSISYYSATDTSLRYANCDDFSVSGCDDAVADWTNIEVDNSGSVGQYTSLGLNGTARHISYYNASAFTFDLKYATCSDNCHLAVNWSDSTIDSDDQVGQYTSLDLDSSNYPHISYYDTTNTCLNYIYQNAGGWQTPQAPSTAGGQYTSIKMDSNNHPHISNYLYLNTLRYAYYNGSSWKATSVLGIYGQYNSLDLYNDIPYVAVYDNNSDILKFVYGSAPTSTSISIDSGATYATSQSTTLTLSATNNGQTEMMISEDSGFSGASWESYSTSKSWTLSSGEGTKTVYTKFRDAYLQESTTISDDIIYDATAPSTTASPAGGDYTSAQTVTLSASDATSGVAATYYTTDGSTPTTGSTVYSSPLTISETTTLKFFSTDNAGNSESVNTETYTITIPTPAPEPTPEEEQESQQENLQDGKQITVDPNIQGETIKGQDLIIYFKKITADNWMQWNRHHRYPTKWTKKKKKTLKRFWKMTNDFAKSQKFKIRIAFRYNKNLFKKLKKKNKSITKKDLVLKVKPGKKKWRTIKKLWKNAKVTHKTKKNRFIVKYFNKFPKATYRFGIGLKKTSKP